MELMMYALIAILLMFIANITIVFARKLHKGLLRIALSVIAFLLLIPSALLVLVVIFS